MRVAQVKPGLIQRGLRGLHRGLRLADHPRRRGNRRTVRVDRGRIDPADHHDFVVGLAPNHCLAEQLTITLHIQLRLDVGGDRGLEIGDAQRVVLLRGFHPLLGLREIGLRIFDRDLVVARVEINPRLPLLSGDRCSRRKRGLRCR